MKKRPVVLVLDDDEDHRFFTTGILKKMPGRDRFRVEEARSGLEALERLRQMLDGRTPVLVLSDFRMPLMSGLEFVKAARTAHPNQPLRVALLTSMEQPIGRDGDARPDAVLVKPVELDELRALLARTVETWLKSLA